MNKKTYQFVSMLSIFAFMTAGAFAADASKIDPKKPVKKTIQESMAKGKSAEVKVTAGEALNSTTPDTTKRADSSHCDIHIDNRTNFYVNRIFIDGRNWGGVGRYGDALASDVSQGATTVYAEVDFSDGSTGSYGPRIIPCQPWSTTRWTLR